MARSVFVYGSRVLTTKKCDIRHLLVPASVVGLRTVTSQLNTKHETAYDLPSDETTVDIYRFMHSVPYMAS
jgi:hypothetical protein